MEVSCDRLRRARSRNFVIQKILAFLRRCKLLLLLRFTLRQAQTRAAASREHHGTLALLCGCLVSQSPFARAGQEHLEGTAHPARVDLFPHQLLLQEARAALPELAVVARSVQTKLLRDDMLKIEAALQN
jgi:hypothetical protein